MTEIGIKDNNNGIYEIAGFVDSQNSYGAMLRTKYLTVMRYIGNETWVCDELHFID